MNSPHIIISNSITQLVKKLDLPNIDYNLEHPVDISHGDYATNLAMVTFPKISHELKHIYSNPRSLAQAIVDQLNKDTSIQGLITSIDIAGPGFINFHLSQTYLNSQLDHIISHSSHFGHNSSLKGKKVVVEYTDPNPFKEFHIGHLYSNTVGESIALLTESSGATVWRADYFGDVGMHVAKSIWGLIQKLKKDSLTIDQLSDWKLNKRIEYLGQSYALGATKFREDDSVAGDIKALNTIIFKLAQETILPQYHQEPLVDYDQYLTDSSYDHNHIKQIYITARQWSLDYFETIYARVGTKFDGYYPESVVGEIGYQLVHQGLKKNTFVEGKDGAIVFPGDNYGLHTRVFINSLGLPTYETKELGLAPKKYQDFPYDASIIVTGKEINEYFQVLITALKQVSPELGNITTHIGHGMVNLPEGKMSSRTGKIVRGEWLLDEAKNKAKQLIKSDLDETGLETVAEAIALGAIKYAFLKQNIGEDIAFDFDTSLSFEGNSGPYLQYTHARCRSVLNKSSQSHKESTPPTYSPQPEEIQLLKSLYRFPEVIQLASTQHAPHYVCTYLFDLAQKYNRFYNQHSILDAKSLEDVNFRLSITQATAIILKNGLTLLSIPTPEKM